MSVQRAKIAKIDSEHCLSHICHDVTGPLTAFAQASWRMLRHAASIRLDNVSTVLQNSCTNESKPIGAYRRQCYQAYTNKKALDKLQCSRDVSISESSSMAESEDPEAHQAKGSTETVCGTSILVSPTNIELCLFCQQSTKKFNGKDSL